MELWAKIFGMKGEVRRRDFFIYSVASALLAALPFACSDLLIARARSTFDIFGGHVMWLLGMIVSNWSMIALIVKRIRDMGLEEKHLCWIIPALSLCNMTFDRGNPWQMVVYSVSTVIFAWLLFSPSETRVNKRRPLHLRRVR